MSLYSRLVRAGGPAALIILLLAAPAAMAQVPSSGPTPTPVGGTDSGPAGNVAPTITMTITHGPNGIVTFSGKVTDEMPAGLVVILTGGPGVSGSAIVLADGTWSTTLVLSEGATGTATATVTDWGGLTGTATGTY